MSRENLIHHRGADLRRKFAGELILLKNDMANYIQMSEIGPQRIGSTVVEAE